MQQRACEHPPTIAGERVVPRSRFVAKRHLDIVIAIGLLIITFPLLLMAMLAIVASSGGSPIFVQTRIGRDGKHFRIYKLRTMVHNAQARREEIRRLVDREASGPVIKLSRDPHVLPIGRFLRKTSIDELPNLINVIKGEMSIVGPRPMQQNEIEYCTERFGEAAARRRLMVTPGITCIWQISGRSTVSFAERIQLDIDYASTWTLFSDLRIILATIPAVLSSRGAC
jgi:lipopolysaccharide/colanic/teichoic acid biosynthesis glycosyltransferase